MHFHQSLINNRTYRDPLLLTDLPSDVNTGPEVDGLYEVSKTAQNTAVTYSLCILADDIARAEINNDAYTHTKKS